MLLNFEAKLTLSIYVGVFLLVMVILRIMFHEHKKCASCLEKAYSKYVFYKALEVIYAEIAFLSFFALKNINFRSF